MRKQICTAIRHSSVEVIPVTADDSACGSAETGGEEKAPQAEALVSPPTPKDAVAEVREPPLAAPRAGMSPTSTARGRMKERATILAQGSAVVRKVVRKVARKVDN